MIEPEASAAWRRSPARTLVQLDEWRVVVLWAEHRNRPIAPQDPQTKRPFVIRERAGEIGDLQSHPSETRPCGEAIAARRIAIAAGRRRLGARRVTEDVVRRYTHPSRYRQRLASCPVVFRNAVSAAISAGLRCRFGMPTSPAGGGMTADGSARNRARYSGAKRRVVSSGPTAMLVSLTARCRWQVTHPFATNSRRPRSAPDSAAGAAAPGATAGSGRSVTSLLPNPLWMVMVHRPGSGTVRRAVYWPLSLPGTAATVRWRLPDFASTVGLSPESGRTPCWRTMNERSRGWR